MSPSGMHAARGTHSAAPHNTLEFPHLSRSRLSCPHCSSRSAPPAACGGPLDADIYEPVVFFPGPPHVDNRLRERHNVGVVVLSQNDEKRMKEHPLGRPFLSSSVAEYALVMDGGAKHTWENGIKNLGRNPRRRVGFFFCFLCPYLCCLCTPNITKCTPNIKIYTPKKYIFCLI